MKMHLNNAPRESCEKPFVAFLSIFGAKFSQNEEKYTMVSGNNKEKLKREINRRMVIGDIKKL